MDDVGRLKVPYVVGSETSKAAADRTRASGRAQTDARMVYDLVVAAGPRGLTCSEVVEKTGRAHQSMSARLNNLCNAQALKLSGEKRPTATKNLAQVYVHAGPFELHWTWSQRERAQAKHRKALLAAAQAYAVARQDFDQHATTEPGPTYARLEKARVALLLAAEKIG